MQSNRDRPRPYGDVLGFLAFSHGWTWFFGTIAWLTGESVWQPPGAYLFFIGGAGVFLGGLIMSRIKYGREGFRELGRRIIDPRTITGRW